MNLSPGAGIWTPGAVSRIGTVDTANGKEVTSQKEVSDGILEKFCQVTAGIFAINYEGFWDEEEVC